MLIKKILVAALVSITIAACSNTKVVEQPAQIETPAPVETPQAHTEIIQNK